MRCPWPAVRLARAFRDGATEVEIVADDPAAAGELAAIAAATGATTTVNNPPIFRFLAADTNAPVIQSV